ncbi:hypothetical protein Slala03_30070 [Streptomyces lavendulae subsp. lavendulae]|uniref:hypothetical protein n=1 Tax=Streptomyces lavendulae TaxID=1914 RepID=UPI0024A60043|nr:hypothetical protein [Streptomyces lavendulae]GLV83318.1 hypothetical protein Slala03_30070 [Streptomyces lavendulae subsp. lavendulae]
MFDPEVAALGFARGPQFGSRLAYCGEGLPHAVGAGADSLAAAVGREEFIDVLKLPLGDGVVQMTGPGRGGSM